MTHKTNMYNAVFYDCVDDELINISVDADNIKLAVYKAQDIMVNRGLRTGHLFFKEIKQIGSIDDYGNYTFFK